ncbi:MAG: hypothetical protein NXI25_23165 [bacterium]|nr:hypothetical protein [bacterium]
MDTASPGGKGAGDYAALSQGMRAEYWHQDHTAKNGVKGPRPSLTRLAFSDYVVQDGVIETQDDPNTPQNDIEITQELHYYPFGMEQLGSCTVRRNYSAGGVQHRSPGQ